MSTENTTDEAALPPVPGSPVRPWSGRSIQEILDADTGDSSLIRNLAIRGRELEAENARMRKALKESLPWIERTYGAMEKQKPVLVEEIKAAIAIPPRASQLYGPLVTGVETSEHGETEHEPMTGRNNEQ